MNGYHSVTVKPKLWNKGRQPSRTAESGRMESEEICAQLAMTLLCERTTPSGFPSSRS